MRFSWLLLLLVGCAGVPADQLQRLHDLDSAISANEAQVDAVAARAATLSAQWRDVATTYDRVTVALHEAERRYALAAANETAGRSSLEQARIEFEIARQHWVWARYLIEAAAAMDASRLDTRPSTSASEARIDCDESMSTAAFRRLLVARGVDLTGKDIDHIVPHALGGADHPANYQVISSSLNRSLGATWDSEKCDLAGRQACARAIVASRGCGGYSGSMPGL